MGITTVKHFKPDQPSDTSDNASKFEYSLTLKQDGSVQLLGNSSKAFHTQSTKKHPPIKEIVNVRNITIIEATGSKWVFINPPGMWYHLE